MLCELFDEEHEREACEQGKGNPGRWKGSRMMDGYTFYSSIARSSKFVYSIASN